MAASAAGERGLQGAAAAEENWAEIVAQAKEAAGTGETLGRRN